MFLDIEVMIVEIIFFIQKVDKWYIMLHLIA